MFQLADFIRGFRKGVSILPGCLFDRREDAWFAFAMRGVLFKIIQLTWGLPQTAAGLAVLLAHPGCPHAAFHGAIATHWMRPEGLSLGMFLFVPEHADDRLLVHEYGHSVQSLILGPAYLLVVGLPSVLWMKLPVARRHRRKHGIAYYSFITERTADILGQNVLGWRT